MGRNKIGKAEIVESIHLGEGSLMSPGQVRAEDDQRALDQLLTINRRGRPKPLWAGKTVLGYGAEMLQSDLDEPITEGQIWIADEDRAGHMGCFGTTRCGKSRLIEGIIEQDIRKNYSVVVMDPKGDQALFSKFIQVAAECGRLEDVMLLTPIFPDYSVYLDPLCRYFMEEELVSHIHSVLPGKDSPQSEFFTGTAESVSHTIISALLRLMRSRGENTPLSFDDIKKRIAHDDLRRLSESLAMIPGTEDLRSVIDTFTTNPALHDYYAKISGSLRDALLKLTLGNTGRVIGKARTNPFIERLERGERVLFFCTLGSMLTSRVSYVVAKVFVSMIQSLAGRIFARGSRLSVPLCMHLDEGHTVLYPGIQELFNKAGGANVWIHLYTQSLAQVQQEAGIKPAQAIIDSLNTWLYFRLNHPETAQHVQETSPWLNRQESVIGLGSGVTFRGMKTRMVQQDKVITLPDRWFYLRSQGSWFKGRTNDVYEPYVRVRFPQVTSDGATRHG